MVALAPAVPCAVSVASAVPAEDASVLSKDLTVQLVNGAAFVIRCGCDIIIVRVHIVVVLAVVLALAPSELRAVSVATAFSTGVAHGGAKGIEGLINFALVWLGVRVSVLFVILLLLFAARCALALSVLRAGSESRTLIIGFALVWAEWV